MIKERNVIYERAKFNSRKQEEGEPVDSVITDLYIASAEHWHYKDLHNEMIRDRIVVGPRDAGLSEKLQLDSVLTLEKVVTRARQAETVRRWDKDIWRTSWCTYYTPQSYSPFCTDNSATW